MQLQRQTQDNTRQGAPRPHQSSKGCLTPRPARPCTWVSKAERRSEGRQEPPAAPPPRRSCACPHAPSLRVPGGGPRGRRRDLTWTVPHPEGLWGRPGGGLCLSYRQLGALLRFGPRAPPAGEGGGRALRPRAEVLTPRGRGRGHSLAGLTLGLHAGGPAPPSHPPRGTRCLRGTGTRRPLRVRLVLFVVQGKKHHRDPDGLCTPIQPASAAAGT